MQLSDNQGHNALAYARSANSPECCQLLIHNGCPPDNILNSNSSATPKLLSNNNGNTPNSNTFSQRKSHSSTSYISGIHNTNGGGLSTNFTQGGGASSHFEKIPFNVT